MRIEITDEDLLQPAKHHLVRFAAAFLLHAIGDLSDAETESPFSANSGVASAAPPNSVTSIHSSVPPPPVDEAREPTPPPPPSNIVNFPVPPPPPPPPPISNPAGVNTAGAPLPPTSPLAPSAAGASNAAHADYDSAGMPWDGRIHQKGKNKKQNGTWKLIKGIDPALVAPVVAELAARKLQTPASPTAGFLPLSGGSTVPVLPQPPGAPTTNVPPPPPPPPMSVPPAPPAGALSDPYRALIDKIVEHTKAGKFDGAKINFLCQRHGAPNLMALGSMPHAITLVDKDVDAAALGLL
jgi:hypothetical protein